MHRRGGPHTGCEFWSDIIDGEIGIFLSFGLRAPIVIGKHVAKEIAEQGVRKGVRQVGKELTEAGITRARPAAKFLEKQAARRAIESAAKVGDDVVAAGADDVARESDFWLTRGAKDDVAFHALSTKDKLLYEIGQKSLSNSRFAKFAHLDPVARGMAIVEDAGWLRAILPTRILTDSATRTALPVG